MRGTYEIWRAIIAVPLLALSCCTKSAQRGDVSEDDAINGRYAVISAGNEEKDRGAGPSVWRLDTRTGALEFCSYGLLTPPGKPPSESISCSRPALPIAERPLVLK